MIKTLWILFFVFVFVLLSRLYGIFMHDYDGLRHPIFMILSMGLPSLIVLIHSYRLKGGKATLSFFLISAIIGMIAEYIGMSTGWIFGGKYSYDETFPKIFGLPILVPFMWGVFIYIAMRVSENLINALSEQLHKIKFEKFTLIFLDCLILISIDLLFDPHQVKTGFWRWREGGLFYGVPLGNFFGWLMVGFIVSFLWRGSQRYIIQSKLNTMTILPLIGYLTVCIYMTIMAMIFQLPYVVVAAILPFFIIAIIFISESLKFAQLHISVK